MSRGSPIPRSALLIRERPSADAEGHQDAGSAQSSIATNAPVAIIELADREGRSKKGSWLDPSGYDAGKKIKGRKRHILVDPMGLLLNVVVHPADIQDRDGAFHLLRRALRLFPFIERIFADGGYAGRKMALTVWGTGAWSLQIVKRSDAAGFEVLPKRWIVERTFASISRNRRLARDFERYAKTVAAFIRLAMIRIMLRRLAANASPSIQTSRMGS